MGFLGFYLHSAKYPGLPTTRIQMEQIDALESQAADRLEEAFSSVLSALPIQLKLPQIFALCMWGIRVFYALLSLLTAIGNFLQGVRWADALARREVSWPKSSGIQAPPFQGGLCNIENERQRNQTRESTTPLPHLSESTSAPNASVDV